ncbi:hypothetical protein V1517DRAFT_325304 [Lipomyces orientalis]|uniref:Uncharacterized protein n=1 Tax=Lipomyces orientalis TaxID=1233043 RepID=A0ACC3TKZ9_9ASCO
MAAAVETQPRNFPLLATPELGRHFRRDWRQHGSWIEAAKHLVELVAAKVVLGVRTVSAGETAKAEIERTTGKSKVAEGMGPRPEEL